MRPLMAAGADVADAQAEALPGLEAGLVRGGDGNDRQQGTERRGLHAHSGEGEHRGSTGVQLHLLEVAAATSKGK